MGTEYSNKLGWLIVSSVVFSAASYDTTSGIEAFRHGIIGLIAFAMVMISFKLIPNFKTFVVVTTIILYFQPLLTEHYANSFLIGYLFPVCLFILSIILFYKDTTLNFLKWDIQKLYNNAKTDLWQQSLTHYNTGSKKQTPNLSKHPTINEHQHTFILAFDNFILNLHSLCKKESYSYNSDLLIPIVEKVRTTIIKDSSESNLSFDKYFDYQQQVFVIFEVELFNAIIFGTYTEIGLPEITRNTRLFTYKRLLDIAISEGYCSKEDADFMLNELLSKISPKIQ